MGGTSLSAGAAGEVNVDRREYAISRCSDLSAIKVDRVCFNNAGPSKYNYETPCSYFGFRWLRTTQIWPSSLWTDFLPLTPGHPKPTCNCALVSRNSLEIQGEVCSIAHKQLCQGAAVIPPMCPAPTVDNGTVTCNLMSKPETRWQLRPVMLVLDKMIQQTNVRMSCGTDIKWNPKISCVENPTCPIFTIANGLFDYQRATTMGRTPCDAEHYLRRQLGGGTWYDQFCLSLKVNCLSWALVCWHRLKIDLGAEFIVGVQEYAITIVK